MQSGIFAAVAKQANARDLKSLGGNSLRVQFPSAAPRRGKLRIACLDFIYKIEGALTSLPLLFPAKLCCANLCGPPLWTAPHSKGALQNARKKASREARKRLPGLLFLPAFCIITTKNPLLRRAVSLQGRTRLFRTLPPDFSYAGKTGRDKKRRTRSLPEWDGAMGKAFCALPAQRAARQWGEIVC